MNSYQFFNEVLPQVGGAPVEMISDWSARCGCPGAEHHTTYTAANHTTVYWNGGKPWINCYHQSCREAVLAANHELRRITMPQCRTGFSPSATAPSVKPYAELAALARKHRDDVLENYRWDFGIMSFTSPHPIPWDDPAEQTLLHLSLFNEDDIVWIGERNYTGKPWSAKNFRPCLDWLWKTGRPLGPLICPSVFQPGTYSRSGRNVTARRFLVVESDKLAKEYVSAIFRMLAPDFTLRAIVDTGGKSLHGWFDYPGDADAEMLKAVLPELDCDPAMFGASQPARLAGQVRDNGNLQRLVYFNPGVSDEN